MELILAKKIFQFFCHQMPDRSLQFGSETFPLCFRCSGIYMGIFISHLYALITRRYKKISPSRRNGLLLILLIIPLAIDGIGDSFDIWNSSGEIRMFTGLLAGIFISITLISIPNLFRQINKVKYDFLAKDFLLPILLGIGTIFLFKSTNSVFIFNLFITAVLIGWGIVVSNILLFVYDSSKHKMYNFLRTIVFKHK